MTDQEKQLKDKIKRVNREKQFLVEALNVLEEGIHIVDDKGNTIFYSKGLEKIEQSKSNQVVGKHISEAYMLNEESSVLLKVLSSGVAVKNYETTYMTSKGKAINIITNTYPIYANGTIVAAVSVNTDITNKKVMTETIYKLQKKLYSRKHDYNNGTEYSFEDIIGGSEVLVNCINIARMAAVNLSPVLIQGETGTGKELFAQSIHNASPRVNGPFVAVNCAAIPETLLESILFGTTKGAFTGAEDKPGLFEEASSGTLFLDELSSMSMLLQSKLLRVLERKMIRRVGGNKDIPVNPRLISAVNLDPLDLISKDLLRRDLYYRLAVVTIHVPPLRDRQGDMPTLIKHFIERTNKMMGKQITGADQDVMHVFEKHNWPGNVRELHHAIEHAMNLVNSQETQLHLNHLQSHIQQKTIFPLPHSDSLVEKDLKSALLKIERQIIAAELKKNNGNISKTSQDLGISRQHLQYRLKRLNL